MSCQQNIYQKKQSLFSEKEKKYSLKTNKFLGTFSYFSNKNIEFIPKSLFSNKVNILIQKASPYSNIVSKIIGDKIKYTRQTSPYTEYTIAYLLAENCDYLLTEDGLYISLL